MHPLPVLPDGRLEQRFSESKPAYCAAEAVTEANRCLYCVEAPCIKACPTGIDIPNFIHKISTGNTTGAARTILKENILGASCARVCPVEVLCAGACVYNAWGREPIAIGRLQRFATEETMETRSMASLLPAKKPPTGKKIALVGAGPASVAAAGLLALEGHQAVIFEKKNIPGGLNSLGIAPYKQSGKQALEEIEWVMGLGDVQLMTGVSVVPGSSRRNNTAIEAKQLQDLYVAVAPDPMISPPFKVELLRRFAEANGIYGLDYDGLLQFQAGMLAMGDPSGGGEGGPEGTEEPEPSEQEEPSRAGQQQGKNNVGGGRVPTGAGKGDKPRVTRGGAGRKA
jgi:hypothetical protein